MFNRRQGWSGGATVSCILRHRGVQLILAHSWGQGLLSLQQIRVKRGRWGFFCCFFFVVVFFVLFFFVVFFFFFFFSLSFLFLFLPCSSLSSLLLILLSLFSFSLENDTKCPTRVDVSLNSQHNQINQQTTYWNLFYTFSYKNRFWQVM